MFKSLRGREDPQSTTDESATDSDPLPLSDGERAIRKRLAEIARKGFYAEPHVHQELDRHAVSLGMPPVARLYFMFTEGGGRTDTDMHIRSMDVDPELRNRGIGSLLLVKAIQNNFEGLNPAVKTISTAPILLSQVRVMQKVLGEENVLLPNGVSSETEFIKQGVRATIDRSRIESVGITQKLHELAENGYVVISP
jgi:hypothetical protein